MSKTFPRLIAVAASLALLISAGSAEARARAKKKDAKPVAESTSKSAAKPAAGKASEAKHGVGKGDSEFGILFDYTHFDSNFDNVTLGAVFGKYLRDTVELRITPVINYSSIDTGGGRFNNFSFLPYVTVEKLFPNASPVVPYVGGGIGLTVGYGTGGGIDTTDLGLFVTPVGGLKFFVSERMALEYALSFRVGFDYRCVDSGGYSSCNTGDMTGFRNDLRFNVYF